MWLLLPCAHSSCSHNSANNIVLTEVFLLLATARARSAKCCIVSNWICGPTTFDLVTLVQTLQTTTNSVIVRQHFTLFTVAVARSSKSSVITFEAKSYRCPLATSTCSFHVEKWESLVGDITWEILWYCIKRSKMGQRKQAILSWSLTPAIQI